MTNKAPVKQAETSELQKDLWRKPETEMGKQLGGILKATSQLLSLLILFIPATMIGLDVLRGLIFDPDWREFWSTTAGAGGLVFAVWLILKRFSVWIEQENYERMVAEQRRKDGK